MKVAVFNNNGGVGKTTVSIILTQIALTHHQHVLGVDIDETKNFYGSMSYLTTDPNFRESFMLKTFLDDGLLNSQYDLMIIDCPAHFDDLVRLAITSANVVVIPVRPDIYSVEQIPIIRREAQGKTLDKFPLVKVGFADGGRAAREINGRIGNYRVIGDLPIHRSINYNLSIGKAKWWSIGLTASARKPFEQMYTNLMSLAQE